MTKNMIGLVCALMLSAWSAQSLGYNESNEDTNNETNEDTNTGEDEQSHQDIEDHIEEWAYIYFPDIGLFPLRQIVTEGSRAQIAYQEYGLDFEHFEPISMVTSNPNRTNIGNVVWMPTEPCIGDLDGDGDVNAGDLGLFALAFVSRDLSADLTQDGIVDHWDQIFFLELVSQGCVTWADFQ